MLFTSANFVLFFAVYVLAFFLVPLRFRWILIVTASYYFYMVWRPAYVLLLVGSTTVSYAAARWIDRSSRRSHRLAALWLALSANLGALIFFKYTTFLVESFVPPEAIDRYSIDWTLDIVLPVGISFFTFQSMSYVIDVYRRRLPAERHWGYLSAYVSFFPQLVAGPIERATNLLPQLRLERTWDSARVSSGLVLMGWGFFKKLCVANQLNPMVATIYSSPESYGGAALVFGTILFSFEIYCDFSGYTDIARGIARTQGFEFRLNFAQPYFAQSFQEFWRRWHISLSSWFRDYLYVPLGGSRRSTARTYLNLLAVFVVSGLWHGASWTFAIWGLLHGVYLVAERAARPALLRSGPVAAFLHSTAGRIARTAAVYCLVTFAWIFFRAADVGSAFVIVERILFDFSLRELVSLATHTQALLGTIRTDALFGLGGILIVIVVDSQLRWPSRIRSLLWDRPAIRMACYCGIFYYIVFGAVITEIEFIYFQF